MSPGRSIAGPAVTRMGALISPAMIVASVVLPRPGGPYSSTWSSGSPRCLAASMEMVSVSLTRS